MQDDDLLTSGRAAAILGVSVMTVVRWSAQEDGPLSCSWTPGGHRRFRSSDVARLRARLHDTTQERPRRCTAEAANTETPPQEGNR
jgi:predicted site-specific integrase-resolvase